MFRQKKKKKLMFLLIAPESCMREAMIIVTLYTVGSSLIEQSMTLLFSTITGEETAYRKCHGLRPSLVQSHETRL